MMKKRTHFAGPKTYFALLGWLRPVLLPYGPSSVRLRPSLPTCRSLSRSFESEYRNSRNGPICG